MPKFDNLVPAVCPNGHTIYWWGGPFMVERGNAPRPWGMPMVCGRCGATVGVQR